MLHLNSVTPSFASDIEPEAKVPFCHSRSMGGILQQNFASMVPPQHAGHISGSPAPGQYSPPSSPSSGVPASAADTSDAEDDNFPLTPQSKPSNGGLYVANPSESAQAGVGSPTPSRSTCDMDFTNAFYPHPMITSLEDQHYFDRFLGRPANAEQSLEDISQKVQGVYHSHLNRLSAKSIRCAVHYKEAVRERKRMRWYTARWEVAEIQRLHTLLRSLCDESETEFIMADRESRWLLDVLLSQQTSAAMSAHSKYANATCDNDKRSLRLADAELALLANHPQAIEQQ